MLNEVKTQVYQLIKNLGYNITDNGTYKENFPWLMLKTTGHTLRTSLDLRYDVITFNLDIFSTYAGEEEIINIVDNIANHLDDLRGVNPNITAIAQTAMKIIPDKETGPVRKHGIVTYRIMLTAGKDVL